MKVEQGLFYSEDHDWFKVDGNEVTMGLTDYAQDHLGDIVYVELPDEDDEFDAGDAVFSIESVKAASDVETPFAGTVVAINEDLDDEPEAINEDPYGSWIVKLNVEDPSTDGFMDADAYQEFLNEQE